MLKVREGKMMYANLLIILMLTMGGALLATYYGYSNTYSILSFLVAIAITIMSVLQIILSMKLYKIAKEESIVESKNKITKEY